LSVVSGKERQGQCALPFYFAGLVLCGRKPAAAMARLRRRGFSRILIFSEKLSDASFFRSSAYSFIPSKYLRSNRSHLEIRACQSPKYLTTGYQPAANYRHTHPAVFARTGRICCVDFMS
jgi:hypothetical protein